MPKNLSIQKIIGILLHRLPMIILSAVLMGLIFFIYTSLMIKPVYSTSSMIYIQNYGKQPAVATASTDDAEDTTAANEGNSNAQQSNNAAAQKIFNSDLAGSASLASNCVTLFQNSNDITSYYDGCSVSMDTTNGTFYITISVSGTDPQKCANVANIVADKCSTVFHNHFPYGTIGTIREAVAPSQPISPNKVVNTMIGAVVGLALASLAAVLLEMVDTTLKNDDDLQKMYKIPVFAEIPDFETLGR